MKILTHLLDSRAVDFYGFNGQRITAERFDLATSELYYIAIRRRLEPHEVSAVADFIACNYPNDSHTAHQLLRGDRGVYVYREDGYHYFEEADIIAAIINDKGLA